jgi:hypothetical protein
LKLGDDWKRILFKDLDHLIDLGRKYVFNDSTWITINTEFIKNVAGTCAIRRCNNVLRWIDEPTGAYYEEPCCIEYLVKEPRNYFTSGSPFITPGGFLHIITQFNEKTALINENQRYLFGNPEHWTCYKVVGTGINDFNNVVTFDNESARILTLDLVADFINNELDDVTNGIADVMTNQYTLSIIPSTAEGSIGGTIQLTPFVTYNGDTATRTIVWTTSNAAIATVSSSGLVTLVTNGSCQITGTIENNSVHTHSSITVKASPAVNNVVKIAPDKNYILEGMTQVYTVYLYENDMVQADTFTIDCENNSVPAGSYTFSSTNNGFTIKNILRSVSSYLTITCTTGGTITKSINIYLSGGW